ncbi:F-box only protein 16 isoform X3 [Narcine bancroftii]|uniref:F-box only protein 16 isoform X3 n=1 Tax=Narcine bancroftii TaxID=1343680 RepID=UPI00383214F7
MTFAPMKIMNGPKMQTKMSTWTPLNHQPTNNKVFGERGELLGKWVNWHWKDLAELDQLWMPKCLRLGWYINFSPTPYEQRIWKRHYIEMVKDLNVTKPKTPPKDEFIVAEVHPLSKDPSDQKQPTARSPPGKDRPELPPWRGSDRHPTDTIRFNYFDNSDSIELTGRKKGNRASPDLVRQSHERKKHSSANCKMRKVKSLVNHHTQGHLSSASKPRCKVELFVMSIWPFSSIPLYLTTKSSTGAAGWKHWHQTSSLSLASASMCRAEFRDVLTKKNITMELMGAGASAQHMSTFCLLLGSLSSARSSLALSSQTFRYVN